MRRKAVVIGSGFAGLSAACHLAQNGARVTLIDKHPTPGGRARQFTEQGFTFDMGPSWYWMPDVFDRFFETFGRKTADYYTLDRLSPSYTIYRESGPMDIPADYAALQQLFERLEPGSSRQLDRYLEGAAHKYRIGMQQLAYKPGRHLKEFMNAGLLKSVFSMDIFTSMTRHIERHFAHPALRQLMSFPVLFLGAAADDIPALYSFMNYADIKLGTWYPHGGMYKIVEAMVLLARELGVTFQLGQDAKEIEVVQGEAEWVHTDKTSFPADVVIGAADYHFIESSLLAPEYRSYTPAYWESRQMAPSCLLYYVGLNKRLPLHHHSLFFDVPFDRHAHDIYADPAWPAEPLFYVSCPSRTDDSVAPPGCENLFILIPVAAGLKGDSEALRDQYFDTVMRRLEHHLGTNIQDAVIYRKSYAGSNFIADYNAFKGNAYGLANTLRQTALLKPAICSRKVPNLFYTGQLTVPGPGVPPSIISGEITATQAMGYLTKKNHLKTLI
jgi:phytoene desaturase